MLASSKSRRIAVALASMPLLGLFVWQSWAVLVGVVLLVCAGAAVTVAFVADWVSRGDEDLEEARRRQNEAKARL